MIKQVSIIPTDVTMSVEEGTNYPLYFLEKESEGFN